MSKLCTRCGKEGEFYKDSQKKDGLSSQCKICKNKYCSDYRNENIDEVRAYDRRRRGPRYRANVAEEKMYNRLKLLQKYKLTPSKFENILSLQNGECMICGKHLENGEKHIDHDHNCCPNARSCGLCIRGILCPKCNMGLGYFNDDFKLLELAITYLKGFSHVY